MGPLIERDGGPLIERRGGAFKRKIGGIFRAVEEEAPPPPPIKDRKVYLAGVTAVLLWAVRTPRDFPLEARDKGPCTSPPSLCALDI